MTVSLGLPKFYHLDGNFSQHSQVFDLELLMFRMQSVHVARYEDDTTVGRLALLDICTIIRHICLGRDHIIRSCTVYRKRSVSPSYTYLKVVQAQN